MPQTAATRTEIAFVDLKSEFREIQEPVMRNLERVLQQAVFIMGGDVSAFEQAFASYCEVKHAVGVANGTDALTLALRATGLQPGDEALVPVNTFIATAEAVVHCGARPVFVDMDPRTYHLDFEEAVNKITPRTKVVLPVHLYGQPVDMDRVMKLARGYGLTVVEDAAQAHGAQYKQKKTGAFGLAGCFSFYPSKNLGCYGDGGAIVTNDDNLAMKLRKLREHGGIRKYQHDLVGYNSRLDTMQAAVLLIKLHHLDEWNRRRRDFARLYSQLLADVPGVLLPQESNDVSHVYHLYVIQVAGGLRQELQSYLREQGIQTGIHYPLPLHLTPAFSFLGHRKGDFPRAEEGAPKLLSLPMHPFLQPSQIEYVASRISQFMRKALAKTPPAVTGARKVE
ncbi:MAG TPA: DegT/DnrJ/EryC1/StrS family aminotransferase [Candidatus Acidoferrales bacterium]|nr:DegT/DnrJ/EryC1/StrS family aminotransferase [Candidatus Acidoferrales bacterium]